MFAGATSVVGLVLALGRYGLLYQWVALLPLVGKFRAPTRHLMLVHMGFSILVAILFEDLRRLCVTPSTALQHLRWLWLPVLISASTGVVSFWRPQVWQGFPDQPLFAVGVLIGVLALGLVTILVRDGARGSQAALMVLPCVFALDLGLWGYSYIFARGMISVGDLASRAAPPPAEPWSTVHQASRSDELNALVLHRLRLLRPYVALVPPRTLTLATDAELRVSGAQWVSRSGEWTRVSDAMPRVRFVPDWRVTSNPAMLSDIDIRRTALVAEDLDITRPMATVDARASLVTDNPGRMVVEVSTAAPALLVTTEAYDRGWRATRESGMALRTLPVYGDYLGIVVEPGDYRMLVVFAPDSMRRGIYTSMTGLLVIALSGSSGLMETLGRDRPLAWTAAIAALVLFLPLFVPVLGGRIFTIDDLSALHAPLRHVYQSALTGGHSVLWTSQLFGGFYIHGEGEVGALHPLHLLLYWGLPLTLALNLEMIFSYVFAFSGMLLFLKREGLAAASTIVGAIAFAFSGFALLHLPHLNVVAVVAHVPWILWAINLSLAEPSGTRAKGLVAVALLFASQALLGHPQSVEMTGLICLLYGATFGRTRPVRLAVVAVACGAGFMLAGIQLVPSFDLLTHSMRRTVARDFALSYSMHPLNLLQLFSPYLLLHRVYAAPEEQYVHEFGVYGGALATIAVGWAMLRRDRLPFARLAVFAAATSILGLLLALGRYGVIYEWLTMLPVLEKFRAPARHIMLVHFGFALLISILFEDLQRLCAAKSKRLENQAWLWLPLLLCAGAGATARWIPQVWTTYPQPPMFVTGMLIGGMVFALTTLLVADAARGSRAALMLVPFLLAIDLGVWGYSYVFGGGVHAIREVAAMANRPPAEPGSTVYQVARIPKLNLLLLDDFRLLRPGVGLPPYRVLTLSTENELRVSGVQWVSGEAGWTRVADAMPRVRIVPEWKVVDDPGALSGIDIRRTALVTEEPTAATAGTNRMDDRALLIADEPGCLTVDVSAGAAALLVTTEAYDRGWRATGASGARLRTLAVYGDYLGVVIEPGEYRMTLAFKPDSMRDGIIMSLTGLLMVIGIAVFVSWKH